MSDPDGILDSMRPRVVSPVLVGRDSEISRLRSAFATVREGHPATVLVGGEAGVGKSRLIGEFTRAEQEAGARVLTGGCLELGADGLPFAPFTAVLRDLVRELGAEAVAGMLAGRGCGGRPRWRQPCGPGRSARRSHGCPAGCCGPSAPGPPAARAAARAMRRAPRATRPGRRRSA